MGFGRIIGGAIRLGSKIAGKISKGGKVFGQIANNSSKFGALLNNAKNFGTIANQISGGKLAQTKFGQKIEQAVDKADEVNKIVGGVADTYKR